MTNLFKVNGQELTPIDIYPAVSDTVNYLTFAFMFSYDWAGLTKSAIFTNGTDVFEVVLTDDQVLESDHVNLSAGTWSIGVVGDLVVDAVVTRQITTSSYDYTVTQSGATSGGVFPPSIASRVYVNVNQATPQTFVGGIPKLAADRVISNDNDLVDKKHVADAVATVTADDFNHNDLANKQGGTTGQFYHVTAAEKTVIQNTSGTNTGDQDVSGAISAHNDDAGAHATLARKSETMQMLISHTIGAGENVSAITWTQDDAGNALALIDAQVRIRGFLNSLDNGSTAFILLRINGQSENYYSDAVSPSTTQMYACGVRNSFFVGNSELRRNGDYIACFTDTYASNVLNSIYVTNLRQGTKFETTSINSINLFLTSLPYFPEGTIIEIYGRTA